MKKNYRGFGFYIVLILVVIGVWYLLDSNQGVNNNYTYAQFEENLKDGDISSVKIDQNREIPTGILEITLANGTSQKLYVSDVNAVQDLLLQYDQDYRMTDVPAESWLMSLLAVASGVWSDVHFVHDHEQPGVVRRKQQQDDEFRQEPREDDGGFR